MHYGRLELLFLFCSNKEMGVADKTSIEWTNATWNPVTGCTKISPGCDNCYAARFSERFRDVPGHPFESGFDLTLKPDRLPQASTSASVVTLVTRSRPDST